jgi:hypothetical protein
MRHDPKSSTRHHVMLPAKKSCIAAGHRHESIPSSTASGPRNSPKNTWCASRSLAIDLSWMITRRLRLIRLGLAQFYTSVCSAGPETNARTFLSISKTRAPSKPRIGVCSDAAFPREAALFPPTARRIRPMPNLTPEGLRIVTDVATRSRYSARWRKEMGAWRSSIIQSSAAWDNGRKAE